MSQPPVIFLAFANERHDGRFLDKLPLELARLREALEPSVEAGLCELVVMPNATVEDIFDTFQKARYKDRVAVFHYAGHADGYQLLLETRDGRNVSAHGAGVVSFLGKQQGLKLVFLNGCSTQQQAQEMIEAGIPAVIGTATSIADDVALTLAERFYKSLGQGASLTRSWREAEDEVKMRKGGTANFRSLHWEGMNEVPAFFPWTLYIRPGAEIVNDWNLPDSVGNPLFGLPEVPRTYSLPEEPYIFLRRFERKHAEVFFGRSYYIRDLYNRITDPNAEPVILLYGQSGVGKSSLFDAGLNPRLEATHQVCYLRRDQMQGLAGTLAAGLDSWGKSAQTTIYSSQQQADTAVTTLGEIEKLAANLDEEMAAAVLRAASRVDEKRKQAIRAEGGTFAAISDDDHPLAAQWKAIEQAAQKPLVVILDQMEELYTRPNPAQPQELHDFLAVIKQIFNPAGGPPRGRLILGYRKEYYAEIEEAFKLFEIPRSKVFLEHLAAKDIVEVVKGLTSTPRLRDRYHLTVEEGLETVVADDLLEDKDSPVAPVLQILLTKMWQNAVAANPNSPRFSTSDYQRLKREGILMDDFFRQQTEVLRQWNPELVESGLALDVLMKHTTRLNTAEMRTVEDLRALYSHRSEAIEALLHKLNDLYLLQGAGSLATGLAHDTLAPIVQREFRTADYPGQRATRIIENKILNFDEANPQETCLDEADLEIVEKGYAGMRVLTLPEQKLVEASRKRRDRAAAFRRTLRVAAIAASVLIISALGVALWQYGVAKKQTEFAQNEKKAADVERDNAKKSEAKALAEEKKATQSAIEAKASEVEAKKQKAAADSSLTVAKQREQEALIQRQEAYKQKGFADAKRKEADENAERAEKNRIEAERQAEIAKKEEERATRARISADSSRYLALAERLAVQSISLAKIPQMATLAQDLARTAWQMHRDNNGLPVSATLYEALNASTQGLHKANRVVRTGSAASDVVRDMVYFKDDLVLMVLENGLVGSYNIHLYGAKIDTFFRFPESIRSLRYDRANNLILAAGAKTNTVYVAAPTAAEPGLKVLARYPQSISDLLLIPNTSQVAALCDDGNLYLLDSQNPGFLAKQTVGFRPNAMTLSPDHKKLIVGGTQDGKTGILTEISFNNNGFLSLKNIVLPDIAPIYSLALNPTGSQLALGLADGSVQLMNTATQKIEKELLQHEEKSIVYQVLYDKTGRFLISGGADHRVLLSDLQSEGSLPAVLATTEGWCRWVYLSPQGGFVAAGGNDKGIHIAATLSKSLGEIFDDNPQQMPLSKEDWNIYIPKDIPYGKTNAKAPNP